jgi:hypothetical protein
MSEEEFWAVFAQYHGYEHIDALKADIANLPISEAAEHLGQRRAALMANGHTGDINPA